LRDTPIPISGNVRRRPRSCCREPAESLPGATGAALAHPSAVQKSAVQKVAAYGMDRVRPGSSARALRRLLAAIASGVVLIGGGVAFTNIDFSSQRVDRDTLSIETVERGTMEIKVSANGQLLPSTIEQLASQVVGRVARAHVKPGDLVREGTLLVELSNPQLIASAEEARSAWEGAVTDLKAAGAELQTNLLNQDVVVTHAQFDLERAALQLETDAPLVAQGAIPELEWKRSKLDLAQRTQTHALETSRRRKLQENIRVQLAVKRARVSQLARALERAENQVADLKVLAGIAGIVQAVDVEVGQQLQAGSPIGRIAQQDRLHAELKVPAREAGQVERGKRVVIDTRRGTVDGVVTRIDPSVIDGTVIVDVEPTGALPAGARPQLQVEGIIYLSELPDTLYVGKPAYVKSAAAIAVYKLDPVGRYAARVTIEAGELSLDHMQVVRGLEAGDRIITSEIDEFQTQQRILLK
jgi:HlyD family secretion protein